MPAKTKFLCSTVFVVAMTFLSLVPAEARAETAKYDCKMGFINGGIGLIAGLDLTAATGTCRSSDGSLFIAVHAKEAFVKGLGVAVTVGPAYRDAMELHQIKVPKGPRAGARFSKSNFMSGGALLAFHGNGECDGWRCKNGEMGAGIGIGVLTNMNTYSGDAEDDPQAEQYILIKIHGPVVETNPRILASEARAKSLPAAGRSAGASKSALNQGAN